MGAEFKIQNSKFSRPVFGCAGQARLAEGTKVRVEPVGGDEAVPTLEELLAPLAGKATGLPSDMAEQHDHYLHGTPRKPRP